MRNRISTQVLANGAIRCAVYDAEGNFLRYEWIRLADDPTDAGTLLNKATLLSDETAAALGLTGAEDTSSGPTPNNALHILAIKKAETKSFVATVGTSWAGNATIGYTQTVFVSGILETDNPIVDLVLGTDAAANRNMIQSWACIDRIVTSASAIKLYAYTDKPQVAMTIKLKVVR